MVKQWMKILNVSVSTVLIFQLIGCGTIFYPERRGQKAGHLDVGVVLLDTIGLLFFIIPGVIAFAVDFSNGTIYLPDTIGKSVKQIKFDPKHSSMASIERTIKEETGHTVKLQQDNINVTKLRSVDDMMRRFAQVLPGIRNPQTTWLKGKENV